MADPPIQLNADASSLVTAIDQAVAAFAKFDEATARIIKDQATLNQSGDALIRTLTRVDGAGNKMATTWRKLEDDIKQTSVVTKAAVADIKEFATTSEAAATATRLLGEATALNVGGLQKEAASLEKASASAFKKAASLEAQAAKHLVTAAAQRSQKKEQVSLDASTRKTAKAAALLVDAEEFEALAHIANAEAVAAEAAAIALLNEAKKTVVSGQLQTEITEQGKTAQEGTDPQNLKAIRLKALQEIAAQEFKNAQKARADNQKTAAEQLTAAERLAAKRIKDAELILAETNKLLSPFEKSFQINLKTARAQAMQAQQMVKSTAEAEKQVGLFAQALILVENQAAARLFADAAPTARGQAAQEGTDAQSLKVIKLKALREIAAQEFKDAVKVRADNKKTADLEIAEFKRIAAAQIKSRKERLAKRRADREKEAADERARTKKLEAEALEAAQREFAARVKFAEALKVKLFKDIQLEKAARLKAINEERAATLATRTPVVAQRLTTGTAGKQEINTFLQAEKAAKKFAATSVTAFKQVDAAIGQARAGTLKFTGNLTQAEQAALKLVAAEKQVALGANQANAASKGLLTSFKSLGNLIGISLLIGGAFRLVQAFTDAAKAAGELTIKIAEIETISTQAARSTESWAVDLRALSNAFGIDTLSQAEGAYQILSRQIKNMAGESIQGAEALKFLEVANKLAVTGVTDTATATNLLTSAMNAFKIPAEEAEVVAAKLFKAVELGALRIEDIANIMGRVAVPAKALGLNLDQVLGSIDGLTRQGFKADEAITGIRNVILKLIKPTKAGSEALRALGADTGQALIQARGFIPGLTAFIEELGDTVEGTAEGFGRIRAIVGALGLTGKNAEAAADSIRQIKDASIESFGEDTQKILRSTGKQFERMREQAQNLFEKELGGPALVAVAKFVEEAGGVEKILRETVEVMKVLGKVMFAFAEVAVFVAENIRLIGAALAVTFAAKRLIAMEALFVGLTRLQTASFAFALAQERVAASTLLANAALLASPIGLALIAGAAVLGAVKLHTDGEKAKLKASEDNNIRILEANKKTQEAFKNAQGENTKGFIEELDKRFKAILTRNQGVVSELNKQQDVLAKQAEATAEATSEILKVFNKSVSTQLSATTKELKDFEKTAIKAAEAVEGILQKEDKAQFDIDVGIAGFGTAIKLIKTEITEARGDVAEATAAGDLKRFETQRKRLNTLVKQRITAEIKFAKAQSKIDQELQEAQADRRQATTREERKAADDRIANLQRQQKILNDGTSQQLKGERAIQKLREQAAKATDAASFKKAIDALSALKREQERLNALAATERRIRAESVVEAAKQAEQAIKIADINKKRAEDARIEQQAIKALQLQFALAKKTAEAFNVERVTEGKTAEEINKAVEEQQRNFAKLITLSRQLTGGNQLDASFIEEETALREQAQSQIDILEQKAKDRRLAELSELLAVRLKATEQVTKKELGNLEIVQRAISGFTSIETQGQDARRAGFGTFTSGGGEDEVANDDAIFQSVKGLANVLEQAILEQTKDFTQERQDRIDSLVKSITGQLDVSRFESLRTVGLSQDKNTGFDPAGKKRASDLTEATLVFVKDIQSAAAATAALGVSQSESQKLVDGIADLTKQNESKNAQAISKETRLRNEHTLALKSSTGFLEEFNELVSGKARATKGPATAPEASVLATAQAAQPSSTQKGVADQFKKDLKDTDAAIADSMDKGSKAAKKAVAKNVADATAEGTKKGAEEGTSAAVKKAEKAAEAARATEEAARKERDANLKKQIAELQAGIEKRRAAALKPAAVGPRTPERPKFKAKKFDSTIRLGQGALPIAVQQARIAVQAAKAAKENEKARKADEANRKRDAAIRQTGKTGVNAKGLFTRGGSGPRPGTFKGGLRPGQTKQGGEGPTQQKQLTAGEQTAANTKALVDAQKAKEAATKAAADGTKTPPVEGVGVGTRGVGLAGAGTNDAVGALASGFGGGQDEALAELNRITGRNADAQNTVLRSAEGATLLWEENNAAQNHWVATVQKSAANGEELARIVEARVPLAQAALDAEQRAFDAIIAAEDAAKPGDITKPTATFGQIPRDELGLAARAQAGTIANTRFDPSGRLRPQDSVGSDTINVGGISVVVNESKTPELTGQKLSQVLNRGLRDGTIRIRSK